MFAKDPREFALTASVPTDIPKTLIAGDTWRWTRTFSDYPATDGWTLSYYVRGAAKLDVDATASGADYAIAVDASDSAKLSAGVYQYIARVENVAGEVITVDSGSITVTVDVQTAVAGDLQSFAEQMVAALETALLASVAAASAGGTGGTVLSYTIAGRSVTFRDEADMRAQLSHYKWQVWRERNPGKLAPRRQTRFRG